MKRCALAKSLNPWSIGISPNLFHCIQPLLLRLLHRATIFLKDILQLSACKEILVNKWMSYSIPICLPLSTFIGWKRHSDSHQTHKYVSQPKAIPHAQILSCFHRNPHTETFIRFPNVIPSHGYSNIFLQFSPYRNYFNCKINSTLCNLSASIHLL